MISKQKKSVEKSKKSIPKKKVKNVNIDKIVKIIKKFFIKSGMKIKKLKGGGPISYIKGLMKGKDDLDVSTCFQNLKDLDETFSKMKDGIIAAKKNLVSNIKILKSKREIELAENNTSTVIEDDYKRINELKLNESIDSLKIVEQLLNNADKKIYSDSEIKFKNPDIDSLMEEDNNTLIIISALNIANALYGFRRLMVQCVNIEIKKTDPDEKKKEMQDKFDKHETSSKEYFNE